jgi:hypothetical protein
MTGGSGDGTEATGQEAIRKPITDPTGVDERPMPRSPLDWLWVWPALAIVCVALLDQFAGGRAAAIAGAAILALAGAYVARLARSPAFALAVTVIAFGILVGLAAVGDGLDFQTGDRRAPPLAGRSPTDEQLRFEQDLRGVVLKGMKLTGADLARRSLQGVRADDVDLRGASLAGARLDGARLSRSDLRGASLRGACLRGAVLRGTHIDGADFTGADVAGVAGVEDERSAIGYGDEPAPETCR